MRINMSRFLEDVLDSCSFRNDTVSLEELVERYDTTHTSALDNHAAVKQRVTTLRPSNPWIIDEIRRLKSKRRRL